MPQPDIVVSDVNDSGVRDVANRIRILREENSILREQATKLAHQIETLRRTSFEMHEDPRLLPLSA
jgi:predicted nuclease with TOPRIM domain